MAVRFVVTTAVASFVAVLALAAASDIAPATPVSASSHLAAPVIEVVGTGAERRQVEKMVDRFVAAGMVLPDVRIRFWETEAGCAGHLGLFDPNTRPWSVHICSGLAFILPHELGHAWERATLTAQDRRLYMREQGLVTWQDPAVPRGAQAIEDIAFVIQLVMLADGDTDSPRIDAAYDQLAALALPKSPRSVGRRRVEEARR